MNFPQLQQLEYTRLDALSTLYLLTLKILLNQSIGYLNVRLWIQSYRDLSETVYKSQISKVHSQKNIISGKAEADLKAKSLMAASLEREKKEVLTRNMIT